MSLPIPRYGTFPSTDVATGGPNTAQVPLIRDNYPIPEVPKTAARSIQRGEVTPITKSKNIDVMKVALIVTLIAAPILFGVLTGGIGPAAVMALISITFLIGIAAISYTREEPPTNHEVSYTMMEIHGALPNQTLDNLIEKMEKDAKKFTDVYYLVQAAKHLRLPDSDEFEKIALLPLKEGMEFKEYKAILLKYLKVKKELLDLQKMDLNSQTLPGFYERVGNLIARYDAIDKLIIQYESDQERCHTTLREIDRKIKKKNKQWDEYWYKMENLDPLNYRLIPYPQGQTVVSLNWDKEDTQLELEKIEAKHLKDQIKLYLLEGVFDCSFDEAKPFEKGILNSLKQLLEREEINKFTTEYSSFKKKLEQIIQSLLDFEGS